MLDDFTGLKAAGANLDGQDGSLDLGPHLLKIGKPRATGPILGMGNIVSINSTFSTNITNSGHILTLHILDWSADCTESRRACKGGESPRNKAYLPPPMS